MTEEIVEICKKKKKKNINKVSCIDNLSRKMLKDEFLTVTEKVCLFFSNCFSTATMPDTWKYAKVTPIPKGGQI